MTEVVESLLERRLRWRRILAEEHGPELRISLLASYTLDPLVPYLGVALHDSGLAARITVSPYNQIVQECLNDQGTAGRSDPHVLVVAARPEELGPAGADGGAVHPTVADEFSTVLDAALAAARRWDACLVMLLPPRADPPDPAVTRLRETALERLAGQPATEVVDLDPIISGCGGSAALHLDLYQLARIPYREPVFAAIGEEIAAMLAYRHTGPVSGVVVVADGPEPLSAAQLGAIERLPTDTPVVVRADPTLAGTDPPGGLGRPPTIWWTNDAPLDDQVRRFVASHGAQAESMLVMTAGPAGRLETPGPPGPRPEHWAAGRRPGGHWARTPRPSPATEGRPTDVAQYVASLDVRLTGRAAAMADLPVLADLLARTADFTLGELASDRLSAALVDPDCVVRLFEVRDRLGDYGLCAALLLSHEPGACVVEAFLVTCPALGRGVETAMLDEVAARAGAAGTGRIVVRATATGRNDLALAFFDRHTCWQGLPLELDLRRTD
ncbi:hypothetical protein ACGFIR_14770 [Micromonospora sp. NPDC049051]|uniref:hypothetical protein n=1 Tax=Micromonospora sp. NPDC049051 TaxID=3364264 RepID=UPI0037154467